MKEEQINTYLNYSEAVKESLIPGYKSDWKTEQPVTPEEQETPNSESPTEPVETPTEPSSDPEVDPNAE